MLSADNACSFNRVTVAFVFTVVEILHQRAALACKVVRPVSRARRWWRSLAKMRSAFRRHRYRNEAIA
jgi:hypothetical protein